MICSICASLPLRAAQVSIQDPKDRFCSKPCSKHYLNVAQAVETFELSKFSRKRRENFESSK